MVSKQKILIVDDDNNIAELISLYLTKECFNTMIVNDGEEALNAFASFSPNLILLDLMLPGIDGYQVCREIRQKSNVPIIMLSAKGEIFDKVLGLELGADDYMIKPFDSKELVARVKAVLRRYQPTVAPAGQPAGKYVEYPDLAINLANYSVVYFGRQIDMPPKELELLYSRLKIHEKISLYKICNFLPDSCFHWIFCSLHVWFLYGTQSSGLCLQHFLISGSHKYCPKPGF